MFHKWNIDRHFKHSCRFNLNFLTKTFIDKIKKIDCTVKNKSRLCL